MKQGMSLAVALAGGNALGAFHAGALCALHRAGIEIPLAAGVSIGSVNAVLFLAPRNGDPQATLRTFWETAAQDLLTITRKQEEHLASLSSLVFGRPTLSRSHMAALAVPLMNQNALQNSAPLGETLDRLVDFSRLSDGSKRLFIGATALDPDENHYFDSQEVQLTSQHVLASCAMPVLFPPVEIGGRFYVDGGVSANLPIEPVLDADGGPEECLALDLFTSGGPPPNSLGAAADRLQSMLFSFQSQLILAKAGDRAKRVRYIAYRSPSPESAGKTLDFSRTSIRMRWDAGEAAVAEILARQD